MSSEPSEPFMDWIEGDQGRSSREEYRFAVEHEQSPDLIAVQADAWNAAIAHAAAIVKAATVTNLDDLAAVILEAQTAY